MIIQSLQLRPIATRLLVIANKILMGLGTVLLIAIVFSFTDIPFWAYYWLGTYNAELTGDPDYLVLMGGGGMPSPDGLLQCFYTAKIAEEFPESRIIIAIPADTARHENSPELLMKHELAIRGIDSTRILYEKTGYNTRSQAVNIKRMLGEEVIHKAAIRIITSPDHMFRSVAAFRKAGFRYVGGRPSFEETINEEMLLRKDATREQIKTEARKLNIRYNMWNYLKYEITVFREWCAIAYYKFKGWI
jgi:uncharacterized SAM-binding protein YcdF (DUF218 family)